MVKFVLGDLVVARITEATNFGIQYFENGTRQEQSTQVSTFLYIPFHDGPIPISKFDEGIDTIRALAMDHYDRLEMVNAVTTDVREVEL